MTAEHTAFAESGIAAERAGDAATALDYHLGIPMFRRSAHQGVLRQLADLAEEMTPWLWARWAAYQCTRAEDPGSRCRESFLLALPYVVELFHGEEMARAWEEGEDPIRVTSRIAGQDWALHQIATYELPGLETFLDTMATGRLAEEVTLAREWVGATMGGYRVEPTSPGRLVVRDLGADRSVEVLDLGAGLGAGSDGWVLGRLVPSGTSPELMFDTRPLRVDEPTARAAATGDQRGAWITALADAFAEGRLESSVLMSEGRELHCDVHDLELLERATPPSQLARTRRQLAEGRDEIGRAAFRLLRSVADGSFGPETDAPYVAAAVLNPHGFADAQRQLIGPGRRAAWERWAELVPAPARGRLARLAEPSATAAA